MFRVLAKATLALCVLLLAAMFAVRPALAQEAAGAEPIRVMILASYHMDNPGRDVHNARIDPVTTPEKQAQLAEVAESLARFRPTMVAIERVAPDLSTLVDPGYPDFDSADLTTDPDERVQIGYRLARRVGLEQVYAIDETDRPGQPSYFPFGEMMGWIQTHGRQAEFDALSTTVKDHLAELERLQSERSVGQLLAQINDPANPMVAGGQRHYYGMLGFGSGDEQRGAELNGRWYTRNAIIFARLMEVAKPGDRVVVIYGAGHAAWLRHFVQTTPGFELVEAVDYLPRA